TVAVTTGNSTLGNSSTPMRGRLNRPNTMSAAISIVAKMDRRIETSASSMARPQWVPADGGGGSLLDFFAGVAAATSALASAGASAASPSGVGSTDASGGRSSISTYMPGLSAPS